MNERFKFRAYNRKTKKLIYDVELINKRFVEFVEDKNIVLMQSTGLKDKNGKLIYEGDMLGTDLKRPYNIVVFRNGMFMLECEDTNGIYYDLFCGVCDDLKKDIDRCNNEIIGNIYENKELLGVEE